MDKRDRWGVWGVIIAVISLLGGMAISMGISTPSQRLLKDETRLDGLEPRMDKVEQSQEDMKDDVTEIKQDVKKLLQRMR